MKLKHEDGHEIDGALLDYQAGDFAPTLEGFFVVSSVEGDTATVVTHPESRRMLAAFEANPIDYGAAKEEAARIHWQTMARGWLVARDAGFVGGEVSDGLHMFTDDEEWVIAKDADDAIAVMAKQYGWLDGKAPEEYEVHLYQLDDDDKFTFLDVDRTCAEWCRIHGRGWFAMCQR